ncbi:MAG TPA: hypothetical protein VMX74_09325 [Pirellulales bacterium]|nr:hypothetical protein [Pirellulales bacterium]
MKKKKEKRLKAVMEAACKLGWFTDNKIGGGYPLMQASEVEKCIMMALDKDEFERFNNAAKAGVADILDPLPPERILCPSLPWRRLATSRLQGASGRLRSFVAIKRTRVGMRIGTGSGVLVPDTTFGIQKKVLRSEKTLPTPSTRQRAWQRRQQLAARTAASTS